MSTFFKRCPSCGRRFEVKHIGEKLVNSEVDAERVVTSVPLSSPTAPYGSGYTEERDDIAASDNIDVEPGAMSSAIGKTELDIEEDTYEETYRCSHCGYQWTEERVRDETVRKN